MIDARFKYRKKILVVMGSTSTGKTDLALQLAKKFNGELISCDSRQIYKRLDIGTGKAPSGMYNVQFTVYKKERYWEIDRVRIWMYDVVNPKRQYTVYDYVQDANRVIGEILSRGKLPIIVGGTGLYLKAILSGLPNLAIPVDPKLRKDLEKLALKDLQKKLQEISLQRWEEMNNSDRQNPRRLVRAIEIVILRKSSTEGSSRVVEDSSPAKPDQNDKRMIQSDILKIGLTAPRETLYQRIDKRVVDRIQQGMIEEARSLHKNGLSIERMRELGLEYGILANYLQDKIKNQEELIKIMQGRIHNYARRQITWFKREKDVSWFDITVNDYESNVENLVAKWYDNPKYATKD